MDTEQLMRSSKKITEKNKIMHLQYEKRDMDPNGNLGSPQEKFVDKETTSESSDDSDELVNSINYNTITSLAALKDILQGDGHDSPNSDSFFQHYFMNHCNNLSRSETSPVYPFSSLDRRRLSQCWEEEEDERKTNESVVKTDKPISNPTRATVSNTSKEPPQNKTEGKRTVMGARHKFLVTPTKPSSSVAAPVKRALRSHVHNAHTVHFGTQGAEEQRPTARSVFERRNLHRDRQYFDSSLIEIRSTVDGVAAKPEDIWVKRPENNLVSI